MYKICTKCKNNLPLDMFYTKKSGLHGRISQCKNCIKALLKKVRQEKADGTYISRVGKKRHDSAWYQSRKEELRQQSRIYQKNNAKTINKKRRERLRKIRLEGIAFYGGKCTCCGEANTGFLTLDHLTKRDNKKRGPKMWLQAKTEGYPAKYTVLCFNCNCAKNSKKTCPHNTTKPKNNQTILETKNCTKCKNMLALNMFYRNKKTKRGISAQCKQCLNDHRGLIRKEKRNGTFVSQKGKSRFNFGPYIGNETDYSKKYRTQNRISLTAKKRQYALKIKLEGIASYGGKCVCCGEEDADFLTLEHIYGRQNEDNPKTGKTMWMQARKENYPTKYTVLCFNCNCAKSVYGKCPHLLKNL